MTSSDSHFTNIRLISVLKVYGLKEARAKRGDKSGNQCNNPGENGRWLGQGRWGGWWGRSSGGGEKWSDLGICGKLSEQGLLTDWMWSARERSQG